MKKVMLSLFALTCTVSAFSMNSERSPENLSVFREVSLGELQEELKHAEEYDRRVNKFFAAVVFSTMAIWALPLPDSFHPSLGDVGACIMGVFIPKVLSNYRVLLLREHCTRGSNSMVQVMYP